MRRISDATCCCPSRHRPEGDFRSGVPDRLVLVQLGLGITMGWPGLTMVTERPWFCVPALALLFGVPRRSPTMPVAPLRRPPGAGAVPPAGSPRRLAVRLALRLAARPGRPSRGGGAGG